MKKSPWFVLTVLFFVFGGIWAALLYNKMGSGSGSHGRGSSGRISVIGKSKILRLELNGMILDGKKLLKPLIRHREDKSIKAIVVEVNSPGGVVGPSQEIFEELKFVRDELKKPVVIVSNGLMASGAYYAALAGSKIVVQPGTLVGSIGVIMQFTNMEKLYDWAKVSRFSITTGKYKDSGAEYRQMRDDERQVFQALIDDVLEQFVEAVSQGRNLSVEKAREVADGRVWTGRQAKEIGLVDEIGTIESAYDLAADLAGIKKDDFEIFEAPKPAPNWLEYFMSGDEEDPTTSWDGIQTTGLEKAVDRAFENVFKTKLFNQPLFLMPGVL